MQSALPHPYRCILGALVGLVFNRVMKVPEYFRVHSMLLCAIANIGNIPIVLAPALEEAAPHIFTPAQPDGAFTYVML